MHRFAGLFLTLVCAVPLLVTTYALAQRKAGDFVPELTTPTALYFSENPDGGDPCVSATGIARTDAGMVWNVSSGTLCPRNATQGNRTDAAAQLGVAVLNAAGGIQDGGL